MLTTPVIRAIRRARPDAHLSYLVESQAAPVVAGNPHLDEVIVTPLLRGAARLREDARLALRLRRSRFDAVIDFHGGPRSSLLALATGARERVGYTIAGRNWMYTTRVPRPRGHRERHSVENQWDLARALVPDLGSPALASDPVEMHEDEEALRRTDARCRAMGIGPSHELIVVNVGAGNEFRRWPEASFAEVAAALAAGRPNRRIILTTGPAQAPRAEAVRRMAIGGGTDEAAISVACDLGLGELRGLVARARLFLGGDSGPAHIAATTATPMVVLFGPTTPAVWGPWRDARVATEAVEAGDLPCRPCDQRVCEPGDFRCLRGISPEAVLMAAERAMARGRASGADPV
ncbi:MAG: glycosyltransferase family 9 protein [Vicinamibacterales bacterium]